MTSIRRIKRGEAELYKEVRLAALRDAPDAFSTSYEEAARRSEQSWTDQADGSAAGPDRATFLALDGERSVGLAALYRTDEYRDRGELIQVWVAPDHRGAGVAVRLVEGLLSWACKVGMRTVLARVAAHNERALAFYCKLGFSVLGTTTCGGCDNALLLGRGDVAEFGGPGAPGPSASTECCGSR